MAFFTDIDRHLTVLREVIGAEVEAPSLPATVVAACDADVLRVIAEATAVIEAVGSLRIAASGVLAARSRRERGHGGVAAGEGHRTAVSLVQEITGTTRTEAAKQVRLGESLLDGANLLGGDGGGGAASPDAPVDDTVRGGDAAAPLPAEPWHAVLGRAKLAGTVTGAQHHAILRGLGEPPSTGDVAVDAEFVAAWSLAAKQLVEESSHRTVEELASAARTIRDRLDPKGAEERFLVRFEGRSFRMWKDDAGVTHARVVFDDESAAFVRGVIDSAMRPRRGGPRFVDEDERTRAEQLRGDPRSNEQLEFDLFFDLLRAGTLADAKTVHGTRQAGVRIVITADAWDTTTLEGEPAVAHTEDGVTTVPRVPAVAHTEDGLAILPAWAAAQRACDTGTRTVWIDSGGEPLRLGREHRLFTPAQRLALAIRDGGCRWRGCDRPASMCEAHHIDPYSEGGHTNVDRGILLCRFHHMNIHHHRWRITRDHHGDFTAHPPPRHRPGDGNGDRDRVGAGYDIGNGRGEGEPIVLKPRLALTYAWAGVHPPPPRSRTAA